MYLSSSPLEAVSMAYVARRLGIARLTEATQRRRICDLVDRHGFPAALPGGKGCRSLRWDRRGVDAWFDDRLPAPLKEQITGAAADLTLAALTARAEGLAA